MSSGSWRNCARVEGSNFEKLLYGLAWEEGLFWIGEMESRCHLDEACWSFCSFRLTSKVHSTSLTKLVPSHFEIGEQSTPYH